MPTQQNILVGKHVLVNLPEAPTHYFEIVDMMFVGNPLNFKVLIRGEHTSWLDSADIIDYFDGPAILHDTHHFKDTSHFD